MFRAPQLLLESLLPLVGFGTTTSCGSGLRIATFCPVWSLAPITLIKL